MTSWAKSSGCSAAAGQYGFLPGRVADVAEFRFINAAAAVVVVVAAVLPVTMTPLWRRPVARTMVLAVC